MTLNDINDVQNAVRATTLAPRAPDDNARFLRGVQLLAEIDDRGGAEIGFSTTEDDRGRLRPDPRRPGPGARPAGRGQGRLRLPRPGATAGWPSTSGRRSWS